MKKSIVISLAIIGIISVVIFLLINNKTSPERRLKQQFDIDISGRTYSIVDSQEQWHPNGDGYFYAEINLGRDENIVEDLLAKNFKSLPCVEDIPKNQFFDIEDVQNGYYTFGQLDSDSRNIKIAAYDSNKNKLYFYYEIN